MKNKFFPILILFFTLICQSYLFSEELNVVSEKISIDKSSKDFIFEGNVVATDIDNNKIFAELARYNKQLGLYETFGPTKIITSEGTILKSSDILYSDQNQLISSTQKTEIIDKNKNKIFLEMFNYVIDKNLFLSKGKSKILDINTNEYNFSEMYIDEKQNKIFGTDVRSFLNDEGSKINTTNEPRFFGNTLLKEGNTTVIEKGVFTYCKNRGEDKCPPWVLQSKKITHDAATKTIYYDRAIVKVYDFPIFYFPKLSHPDPTVKRRSGFLMPALRSSSNVGVSLQVPYFWSIADDKDITFAPKIYASEHPLYLAEYRQDFKNSYLLVDGGYTKGYEKESSTKSSTKTKGARTHLFSKLNVSFPSETYDSNNLEINLQQASNDTYFKVHDINSLLVDKNEYILENSLDYKLQNDDLFFSTYISAFDNLTLTGNKKYEYLLPYITLEKGFTNSEKLGQIHVRSNVQVRNYDTNKQTEFLVNDFFWDSNKWINSFGFENQFEGMIKTVNYNANNDDTLKSEGINSELSGAVAFKTELDLFKNDIQQQTNHLLTPKLLFRYAPGHMRRVDSGRLKYENLYNINKINVKDVIENGFSTTIGVDYRKSELDKDGNIGDQKFSFAAGQVISENENNDIPGGSSLDQRFSSVVGESTLNVNNKLKVNYNFDIDQNYKKFNYNEIGADLELEKIGFNMSFLEEKNYIGDQRYIETTLDYNPSSSSQFSLSTKRNLLSNSSEFYNFSYDYKNDCLIAGVLFRREFYTDRDIEPENSIMFTISLIPFANLNSPTFKSAGKSSKK